jgi:hypothetical protein
MYPEMYRVKFEPFPHPVGAPEPQLTLAVSDKPSEEGKAKSEVVESVVNLFPKYDVRAADKFVVSLLYE